MYTLQLGAHLQRPTSRLTTAAKNSAHDSLTNLCFSTARRSSSCAGRSFQPRASDAI
jgi:hypothetical protein